jgi:hypothetical protein
MCVVFSSCAKVDLQRIQLMPQKCRLLEMSLQGPGTVGGLATSEGHFTSQPQISAGVRTLLVVNMMRVYCTWSTAVICMCSNCLQHMHSGCDQAAARVSGSSPL